MRIGIHQPNFLPWMGYFYKIAQCDTFVLLDNVEFSKQSYTKRVKIHHAHDQDVEQYLILPLQKHSDHARINELSISQNEDWQKKIRNQLYETYHKAPYYSQIEPLIHQFFTKPIIEDNFCGFTGQLISYLTTLLGLHTTIIRASNLDIEALSEDVNLNLVKALNGTLYVSGMGGKKYQSETLFHKFKVAIEYSDYRRRFKENGVPQHFYNKSIISYLAHYDIEVVREGLLLTDN